MCRQLCARKTVCVTPELGTDSSFDLAYSTSMHTARVQARRYTYSAEPCQVHGTDDY